MQQLVEYDLPVGDPPLRHCQHGAYHAADEGALQARHAHRAAGPEAVFLSRGVHGGAHGGVLPPPPEQGAQPRIAVGVPDERREHAGGVEHEKPVRQAARQPARKRHGRGNAHELKGPREGRIQPQLGGGLRRLRPERQLRHKRAPQARRYQRPERQHAPHGVLPARRELVAQQPFHRQQHRRRQRDAQRLIEELPDIAHVTPPSRRAAAGGAPPRRAKCATPSKTRR